MGITTIAVLGIFREFRGNLRHGHTLRNMLGNLNYRSLNILSQLRLSKGTNRAFLNHFWSFLTISPLLGHKRRDLPSALVNNLWLL